ncbi:dephospho-CoA kinase [Bacteroidia bacterium]|nr:dephospho-CoA kinase [Bacteroidia bacterium]
MCWELIKSELKNTARKNGKRMVKIGLTGGIGAGKTTVATVFKSLGYPVYISDIWASWLMNTDLEIRESLIQNFGKKIYLEEFGLNKKYLSELIFCSDLRHKDSCISTKTLNARQIINSIVHPKVLENFAKWTELQDSQFVIFESAIIFESGLEHNFDAIISVYAGLEVRIQRVMRRDHVSREKVMERINKQMDARQKCEKADYVIYTDEGKDMKEQIINILQKIRSK